MRGMIVYVWEYSWILMPNDGTEWVLNVSIYCPIGRDGR